MELIYASMVGLMIGTGYLGRASIPLPRRRVQGRLLQKAVILIKVFSFVGSQAGNKSRTARFSDMVADKLKSYIQEPIAYERLTGADVHLDFCRSCESCFSTGKCPADAGDDMGMIKQKMLEADMLFFCSPVYAGSMSATAKAVVDRLAYWCHREVNWPPSRGQ